jgi:hypothetical protein
MTHTRAPFCTALFVAASLLSCLPLFAQPAPRHIGRVNDSSYHHLLVSGGPTQQNLAIAARESRALLRLSEHNMALLANFGMADLVPAMPRPASAAGRKPLDGQPLAKMTDAGRKVDWAVDLGTGPLAPNTFAAKYSLNVNATPDCINDYAVYGTNVTGKTGGQANVIGINNLYSGSNPTGFCGTTPTIDFAYNGMHDGAFDDRYINGDGAHGHLFTCGTDTAFTYPDHYWIGFSNYPTMDTGIQGMLVREYSFGVPCSPYTEFWNPNVNLNGVKGEHDILASSLIGGSQIRTGTGWIATDDITQGTVIGVNAVNYPGGTSGVIADNISTEAQASSFYFGTLGPSSQGTCATTNCAVKLTQTSLQ